MSELKSQQSNSEVPSHSPQKESSLAVTLDSIEGTLHTAREFPIGLMEKMKDLTAGIDVDLDAPINGDVDI